MDLPPAVAAALDLPNGWPVASRDRTSATLALRRLDRELFVDLVRWAHEVERALRDPPSPVAWAARLGVSRALLQSWRLGTTEHGETTDAARKRRGARRVQVAAVLELAALPVAARGRVAAAVAATSGAERSRAWRARVKLRKAT